MFTVKRQVEESEEPVASISVVVDTLHEPKSGETKEELCVIEAFTVDSMEKTLPVVDYCDELRSCPQEEEKQTVSWGSMENAPTVVNYSDESRSRSEHVQMAEHKSIEKPFDQMRRCGEIDSCDESKNREQYRVLRIGVSDTIAPAHDTNIDVNHSTEKQTYKSGLAEMCDSRQKLGGIKARTKDDSKSPLQCTVNENVEGLHTSKTSVNDCSDESRHRDNSCCVSTSQSTQQPGSSVEQNRCIEPTMVNSGGIDECPVTNKCELHKQHSIQTSTKWLSNTLSKFTSKVLGKTRNKNTTGEELVENINTKFNPNLTPTSEFTFFL